jgi:hypothetical protein
LIIVVSLGSLYWWFLRITVCLLRSGIPGNLQKQCAGTGGRQREKREILGDGQRWRLWHNGDNDYNIEEGGSHPTLLTTATPELAARLHSSSIMYASEASL